MAPLFEHYGVQLWTPEAGGRVDFKSEHDEKTMTMLGLSSKREITRTSIRVRTATAVQTREQSRYLGGRPPYGYRLPAPRAAPWGRGFIPPAPGRPLGAAVLPAVKRGGNPVPVRGRPGQEPAPHSG